MTTFPYNLTDRSLTILIDAIPYHVEREASQWEAVKKALSDPNTTKDRMLALVTPREAVNEAVVESEGRLELRGSQLFYQNEPVHSSLASRIVDVIAEGFDVMMWMRFAEKVYANPNTYARDEFYDWLMTTNTPIAPDGDVFAFKNVRGDYLDIYSGTFDNSVGQVVEVPREAVDPNRNATCSTGLHVCSRDYLPYYTSSHNGRTMMVKVSPTDFVSIPTDHGNAKARVCRYEVVGEIPMEQAQSDEWPAVMDDTDPDLWDEEPWEDDEEDVIEDLSADTVVDSPEVPTRRRLRRLWRGVVGRN